MRASIFGLILLAAACAKENEDPAEPTTQSTPASDVTAQPVIASDELGGFEQAINGIAFWTHPTLAFSSVMAVSTESGLKSFDIETGEEVASVDGINPAGVSIGYDGIGPSAKGIAALYDTSEAQFRFYSIDNETRAFQLLQSLLISQETVTGFCLGKQSDGPGLALHSLSEGRMISADLNISPAGVSASQSSSIDIPGRFVDCVVDDLDGAVFALNTDGEVFRFVEGAPSTAPFAISNAIEPKAIGLSLSGLVEGGPTDACCGQLAVLDQSNAHISLFDRDDGHALGVVTISASYDVDGVSAAMAMGLGYGNFGATYRDGVLVLATDGQDGQVLRLTPWNSVLIAVEQPLGEVANPRNLAPQTEEDGAVIDLSVIEP